MLTSSSPWVGNPVILRGNITHCGRVNVTLGEVPPTAMFPWPALPPGWLEESLRRLGGSGKGTPAVSLNLINIRVASRHQAQYAVEHGTIGADSGVTTVEFA